MLQKAASVGAVHYRVLFETCSSQAWQGSLHGPSCLRASILWNPLGHFLALATRWQYHLAVCPVALCQQGDGFDRGESIIISIYTGSKAQTVAQLWSGCVTRGDKPIRVMAPCACGLQTRRMEGFVLWIPPWETARASLPPHRYRWVPAGSLMQSGSPDAAAGGDLLV